MLRVRRAGAGDAPRIALAAQATFLDTFAGQLAGEDIVAHCHGELGIAAHERWLADPRACLWLAETEAGSATVGYALLAPADLPVAVQPGDLELKRIYLLSRFHGGGAGAALLTAAVDEANRRGAARLLLGVYASNHRAIAFYTKHGFVQIGERQFQVGGARYQDVVLARPVRVAA